MVVQLVHSVHAAQKRLRYLGNISRVWSDVMWQTGMVDF